MSWTEERPWGRFKNIFESDETKVKLIEVSPRNRLSYQSHQQRSETWIVIAGQAHIVIDDRLLTLNPGQSVHIPAQAKHRLENRSDKTLHIIEVQTGSYFGEDDIQRFQDDFGRL